MNVITKVRWQDIDLADCVRKSVPLVITTPATWGLGDLQSALRAVTLTAYRFPRTGPQCARQDAVYEPTTLDEFIASGADDQQDKVRARKIISNLDDKTFTNLSALFPAAFAKVFQPCRKEYRNLWVNRKGDGTALHYDLPVGFNLQLLGSKTYYICAPRNRGCYSYSWLSAKGHCSRITNIFDVNAEQFPGFRDVLSEFQRITVSPGEIMFMPSCWWHQVDSHAELNMNLTWGWVDRLCALKHPRQTAAGIATYAYRKLFYRHIY